MSAIKSSRLPLLSILYLTLLLSLSTLAPTVVAQGNGNPPYPPGLGGAPAGQPEGPTPMRFRPPRDAAQMTDFLPEGAVAHGITNAPGLQNSVPLVPVKDNLVYLEDNTVGVLLEDGMVDTPAAELRFRQQATPQYSPEMSLSDDGLRMLVQFEVGIYDRPSGNEMRDWQSKARIIVDLRDLADEADLGNASFFLMYRDEEDPDVWHPVDIDVHQETGLISAEVSHFSEWSAGITAERWSPSFIEPDVSTFSGAATYSYPIQVPAGRGGLQPSVALSYSSRAIDGRILDTDAGPVADGWSLADISIVRDGAKMENCSGNTRMLHEDKFRLTLNGAGHRLFAAPGAGTKWGGLRYYSEDAPGYYIERLNHTGAGHTSTTPRYYWGVITPNGTIYRMGYNERSEASHSGPTGRIKVGDCTGTSVSRSGTAWYIDEVTDVHGNKIYYDYLTNASTENQSGWTLTTTRRRIYDINYNHDNYSQPQVRIRFLNGADNLTNYTYSSSSAELESIFIYDGGSSTPRLEYRLDTQDNVVAGPGCPNYDTPPPYSPRYNNTVTLESIQLVAGTDNNPDTADTPVGSLPATTFSYNYKPHFYRNGQPCFQFYYLTGVDNGYGGNFTYTYLSDSRSYGSYVYISAANYEFPQIGYSYVVNTLTRNDGQTSSTSVEYEYYKPCYDQLYTPTSGQFVDEFACGITADDPPEFSGALVGFEWVTVRPKDSSGNVMNVTTTNFAQGADWRGRAKSVYTYQSNGTTMMQKVENTYVTQTLSAGSKFTYLSETKKTVYEPDTSGGNSMVTRQVFGYNTALQGGAYGGTQYGNQTVVWDYGNDNDGGADNRTIITCYYPNGSTSSSQNWLVGLPAIQRTFNGIIAVSANLCNSTYTTDLLNETRTIYDFNLGGGTPTYNNYTTVPTKGLVTTTFSGKYGASLDGGTNGFIRGQTFEYDSYGNPDTITSNSDVVTTVTYDSAVHMYPLSVTVNNTDFTAQTTTYQFYGVNSVSNSANGFRMPYGAVRKITDPNGLYQIMEYDPFGRLHATYEDESDRSPNFYVLPDTSAWDGDPVARYRYWDNSWNSSMYSGFISDPMAITEEARPETYEPTSGAQNGEVSAMSTNIYYDGFGREIQTRSFTHQVYGVSGDQDLVTLIGYGDNGQANCQSVSFAVPRTSGLVTATCASKAHTTTDFDDLGRQTSVTTPDGNATTFAYYILANPLGMPGNATAVNTYDAEGRVRSNWMDALGQLIQVVDHTGTSSATYAQYGYVNYEYDKLGNLTQVETVDLTNNNLTLTTELQYDVLGRKVRMDDPDMGVWEYTYDAQGNLIVQEDAKGLHILAHDDQ
ncbi:MAG: hypothetical protein KDE09_00475 [Anaerolineales bacterium]|nr:hypothetical protein [Anaerolineales bacterium]MCB0026721.1 hypothetical protein [Anaerolineales bacterium]